MNTDTLKREIIDYVFNFMVEEPKFQRDLSYCPGSMRERVPDWV